jgi:hypothetical protein
MKRCFVVRPNAGIDALTSSGWCPAALPVDNRISAKSGLCSLPPRPCHRISGAPLAEDEFRGYVVGWLASLGKKHSRVCPLAADCPVVAGNSKEAVNVRPDIL